jgi:hypothetical protein
MTDHTRKGLRCRTNRFIRTVEGDLPRASEGTIRYEIDNLGRRLVLVDWDQGFTVPVFPHEIELCAPNEARL